VAPAASLGARRAAEPGDLPELAAVWWRPRASPESLRRTERLWLANTAAHTVPFLAMTVVLAALKPLLAPIVLLALAQAWIIPELQAAKGAAALKHRAPAVDPASGAGRAERTALGLLGDLLDHRARHLHARTGLVLEPGRLGVWLLGEAGAVLVRPGGRRVHCYCVKPTEPALPRSDRVAHLLLALRGDETGFATVANVAFCGARWRLHRRLGPPARPALEAAAGVARTR
jgi:hypothetical protein